MFSDSHLIILYYIRRSVIIVNVIFQLFQRLISTKLVWLKKNSLNLYQNPPLKVSNERLVRDYDEPES